MLARLLQPWSQPFKRFFALGIVLSPFKFVHHIQQQPVLGELFCEASIKRQKEKRNRMRTAGRFMRTAGQIAEIRRA